MSTSDIQVMKDVERAESGIEKAEEELAPMIHKKRVQENKTVCDPAVVLVGMCTHR
jgi:hypothetical protein